MNNIQFMQVMESVGCHPFSVKGKLAVDVLVSGVKADYEADVSEFAIKVSFASMGIFTMEEILEVFEKAKMKVSGHSGSPVSKTYYEIVFDMPYPLLRN